MVYECTDDTGQEGPIHTAERSGGGRVANAAQDAEVNRLRRLGATTTRMGAGGSGSAESRPGADQVSACIPGCNITKCMKNFSRACFENNS